MKTRDPVKPRDTVKGDACPFGEIGCDPRVERTRAAALAAARELLDEEGWDAVTHVAVSERSGVGRTTLYRHWPTAELLVLDVLADKAPLLKVEPCGDLYTDLFSHLDGLRQRMTDPARERSIVTVLERATIDPAFAKLRAALARSCTKSITDILRAAIDRKELDRGLDLDAAVDELAGPLVFRHMFARRRLTRAFVAHVVRDFLRAHQGPPSGLRKGAGRRMPALGDRGPVSGAR